MTKVMSNCPTCKGVGTGLKIQPNHQFEVFDCPDCGGTGKIEEEGPMEFHVGDYYRRDGYDYEIVQVFKSTLFVKETAWPTYLYDGQTRLVNRFLFEEAINDGEISKVKDPGDC